MLATWVAVSAVCLLAADAVDECGPSVVPLSIMKGKPCQLRFTRNDLNVSDTELWAAVLRGLEKGAVLAEKVKEHEKLVARRLHVMPFTPEYHHYLTNEASETEANEVMKTLEDLANVTALARHLAHKFNITDGKAGDLLIDLQVPAVLSHIPERPNCNASHIYRTYNGSCNNLKHPLWGTTDTVFHRLVKSRFSDGIHEPKKSATGEELPNPRVLRKHLMPTGDFDDETNTLMVMQFGQLIAHDMALSGDSLGADGLGVQCCSHQATPLPCKNISVSCYPIKIPEDDEYYAAKGVTCMSVARSMKSYTLGGYLGPAETLNSENHLLDCSFTYGFDESRAEQLREYSGGRLRVQTLPDGRKVLPQISTPMESCSLPTNGTCFIAGDVRVNQNTQLTVLQIMFLREHNRVADKLSSMNPHWDDEKIFQETRRILIGEHQHMIYTQFLPQILRKDLLEKFHILSNETGYSSCYKDYINPSTLSEFTEQVYRVFHGIAQSKLLMYKDIGCPVGKIKISQWMDKPEIIVQDDHLDQLTLGLTQQPATKDDRYTVYEMNRNLFKVDGPYGQDLDMFDIVRGRDNGVGFYNDYRELIGLKRAETFEDFTDLMSHEDAMALKQNYDDPEDVELMAVMLEKSNPDVLSVREAIIADQFYRWKCGDRFFYDYEESPYPFTPDQINEIKKVTMSRIICDNSDNITRLQANSFKLVSDMNPVTDCTEIPEVDLSYWKEEQ